MMNDMTHYMESTSRLRAENEELREQLKVARLALDFSASDLKAAKAEADVRLDSERVEWTKREQAEATMREIAEELRGYANLLVGTGYLAALADRLDPPSVVENPSA